MPQEFHVIQCFSCKTFQVHIVKKSNKWICKMCGEKQSLKKVYGQGSGKACRIHVQALNQKRILNHSSFVDNVVQDTEHYQNTSNVELKQSKWSKYLPEEKELPESNEDNIGQYTFERPNKRKLSSKKEQCANNKKVKPNIDENCENIELYNNDNSGEIKIILEAEDEQVLHKPSKWDSFIQLQDKNETVIEKNEEKLEKISKWKSCITNNENSLNLGLNIYNCTDVNSLDAILDI